MTEPPVTHPSLLAIVPVRAGELCAGGEEALAEALAAGGSALLAVADEADLTTGLHRFLSERVHAIVGGGFAPARWAEILRPQAAAAQVLILPASPDGRDLAPRLAAALGRRLIAGALQITASSISVPRQHGTELHRFAVTDPVVATLQVGVRGVVDGEIPPGLDDPPGPHSHLVHHGSSIEGRCRDAVLEALQEPDVATMDLAEAPRIMGGGAGLSSAEDFVRLEAVAHALGASMGATRVITDRGWIHHDRQIGTTGVIVDPELYLAWGISGAVQHTAGLGHPDHIIAINTDPHCPMMQLADLGIVSDATEVLRHLATRLGIPDA